MANRIIYKPQGIILSSSIGDLSVAVDGTYIDVTLTGPGGHTILSERYYAYTGTVTLYDLGSIIESEMSNSGYTFADYTLRVFADTVGNNSDSCTLHVLYCDRYVIGNDIPLFLSENFLTTLTMRRIAPVSTVSLLYYAEAGESTEYSISHIFRRVDSDAMYSHTFYMRGGETATYSGIVQINIPLSLIIADAAAFATAQLTDVVPLSFTVRCGQRSISFFIDPALADSEMFFFRNCFNVWDWLMLPTLTTAKTDVERSTALINGSSRFYDQSVTKSYEVEVGPLTSDEADWIDQLFCSYDVIRIERNQTDHYDPYTFAPILITESTCEMQDGSEKLNSAKFTWRYADNRPVLHLTASPGIFTSPYNLTFS